MRAFRRRLRLPMRHNGAGLIGVHSISAAAFVGSVVAAAHADPVLLLHLDGLTRFAQPALAQLQARFAPLGADASNELLKLPMRSPADLLDPSRYVEPDSNEKLVVPKLQQKWSRSVHEAALRTLSPEEQALGRCDFVHSHARARPAAAVLQLPLSNPFFRLAPLEFVSWFRFQFRIPQLARIANANADGVEQCIAGCKDRNVDLHGNHAHSGTCKATKRGRGLRHRLMKNVVSYHAAKAGCIPSWVTEETAPDLLLDEFTVEECSTMFYTNPTAEFAQRTHEVLEALRAATSLPQDQRAARLAELRGSLRELMDSIKGGHSVRPDGTILHPASQETVWFDTAGTHTTCKSHLVAEHKHTLARRAAGRDGARMASARLLEEYRIKIDRYALLAAIAERQLLDDMRPVAPLVLPVVVSTHGEFCPGAVELQEWLVEKYRLRLLLEGPRDDGEVPEDLTACFRRELRASLLLAMIRGTSASLNAAGLPKRFKPKATLIVPPTPSTPAPPSPVQDSVEDGEVDGSDDSDSDSDSSPTSGADTDSGVSIVCEPTPDTAAHRRSARIAQQSGDGRQRPTPPTLPTSAHFSLDLDAGDGFPLVLATRPTIF